MICYDIIIPLYMFPLYVDISDEKQCFCVVLTVSRRRLSLHSTSSRCFWHKLVALTRPLPPFCHFLSRSVQMADARLSSCFHPEDSGTRSSRLCLQSWLLRVMTGREAAGKTPRIPPASPGGD